MKFPTLISFTDYLNTAQEYDCIIDVRSPGEFAEDHIPGSINCPVLNDEERIKVGTIYKQVSAFEAKKVGAALVAKNIGEHIEQLFLDKDKNWRPLITCWRGGNRSGSMTHILNKIGWHAAQLDGGYKSYRQFVNASLPEIVTTLHFVIICGETGSGKSRLLQTMRNQGAQVLDLEEIACHRGSVLGGLPTQAQPAQKYFESQVWQQLRQFDPKHPIFVEAESKKIGNVHVPPALMERMRASPCLRVESSLQQRVEFLLDDYAHFTASPTKLKEQLLCLSTLYGKEKINNWCDLIDQDRLSELVEILLATHYDPGYRRGTNHNYKQAEQAQCFTLRGNAIADFDALAQQILADFNPGHR